MCIEKRSVDSGIDMFFPSSGGGTQAKGNVGYCIYLCELFRVWQQSARFFQRIGWLDPVDMYNYRRLY